MRLARERGRSPWAWLALATVAAVAVAAFGLWSFGLSIFGGSGGGGGGGGGALLVARAMVAPLAVALGPLAAVAAVLVALWRLPERVPTLGGARWRVYRLSSRDEPAGECELAVAGGVVRVGDWTIAAGALTELVADGECLRIAADGRSRTLMPVGDSLSSREKAKKSQALAKRLRALVG